MDSSDARYLILGANGQLGKALQQIYPKAKAVDSAELDITNFSALQNYDWSGIEVILNAAAYTNVDGAETQEGRLSAWSVNAQAVSYLADIARSKDIVLVQISTDYVFDGTKDNHKEDESFSPLSVYGATKAAADLLVAQVHKHYILRTSWVIGDGHNFVKTMLGLGQKGINPKVVSDQIGRLTFTDTLATAIDHLLSTESTFGTYNLTNSGESASWAQITREIFNCAGFNLSVTDTTTLEYFADKPNIAPRPTLSTLDLSKIEKTGFSPKDWREDLVEYVKKEMTK